MGLRTVRLDDEDEALLEKLREQTGESISEVLRRGLRSYNTSVNGIRLGSGKSTTVGEAFRRIMDRYDDQPADATQDEERGTLPPRRYKEALVAAIRERHAQ